MTDPCVIDCKRIQHFEVVGIQLQGGLVFLDGGIKFVSSIKSQGFVEMPGTVCRIYLDGVVQLVQSLKNFTIFV
jgi:hypothetical protein